MAETNVGMGLQAQLEALRQQYIQQLPGKLAAIAATWDQLSTTWDMRTCWTMHRQVHSLAGSGATFGFAALTETARALEHVLQANSDCAAVSPLQWAEMSQLLDAVKEAAAAAQSARPRLEESVHEYPIQDEQARRLIFLVEPDAAVGHELAMQISHFSYTVQVFADLADLRAGIAHTRPAAIILDTQLPSDGNRAAFAAIQAAYETPIPVVFVSSQRDLRTRLAAVRANCAAYFVKPVNVGGLIDTLDTLTTQRSPEPYRVLIVDDEPMLAAYYAATLRHAGMHTTTVVDPPQIMQPLEDFRPDLILMDMYMPECTGLELAAVIRQQEAYVSTPIVFLSAETDVAKQLAAMSLGGDDFLTKPIQPDHLISAVTSRVQRSRSLRSFMIRDSLTGLLNHTRTREQINLEVARAKRGYGNLALAMLDIDHFKAVNDTYGHPTGDRVIKSLSRLLQQRLRRTDIVGRYGGEEFAVALLDIDAPSAVKVMNELRAGFAQIRQQSEQSDFFMTFSCGIASLAQYGDANTLMNAADKALYAAKRAGRNRVVLANDLDAAHRASPELAGLHSAAE